MPLITLPTRIATKSKTLIDNILYNQFSHGIKSGNINVSISDHSPQFAIIPLQTKKFKSVDFSFHRWSGNQYYYILLVYSKENSQIILLWRT